MSTFFKVSARDQHMLKTYACRYVRYFGENIDSSIFIQSCNQTCAGLYLEINIEKAVIDKEKQIDIDR